MSTLLALTLVASATTSAPLPRDTPLPRDAPLTLDAALALANAERPLVAAALADVRAAEARVREAEAPRWPSLNGTGAYALQTANFIARPGALPSSLAAQRTGASFDLFGFWNFGLTASYVIWDFGAIAGNVFLVEVIVVGAEATLAATRGDVELAVRTQFAAVGAQAALAEVARAAVEAAARREVQIARMVEVGTKPEVDLAQARSDRAAAQLKVVQAENAERQARSELLRVLGLRGDRPLALAGDPATLVPQVDGEDGPLDALLAESGGRSELRVLGAQATSIDARRDAAWAAFFPSLGVATGFTTQGPALDALTWNVNGQLTLSWSIFSGFSTVALLSELDASRASLEAQRRERALTIEAEVRSAALAIRAAKAQRASASEVDRLSKERLRLAEGRYGVGVGTIIELSDAQAAAIDGASQRVQADFQLAVGRAQLLHALGRLR
jgi:outer membrane protein